MLKYREFLSLTDEEIEFIIKDIFPYTTKVDNITRDEKWNRMTCDIYIMEEYPEYADTLYLEVPSVSEPEGITTHDFTLTADELWKWQQYLLAKGVDERLKDNPYIMLPLNRKHKRNDIITEFSVKLMYGAPNGPLEIPYEYYSDKEYVKSFCKRNNIYYNCAELECSKEKFNEFLNSEVVKEISSKYEVWKSYENKVHNIEEYSYEIGLFAGMVSEEDASSVWKLLIDELTKRNLIKN